MKLFSTILLFAGFLSSTAGSLVPLRADEISILSADELAHDGASPLNVVRGLKEALEAFSSAEISSAVLSFP